MKKGRIYRVWFTAPPKSLSQSVSSGGGERRCEDSEGDRWRLCVTPGSKERPVCFVLKDYESVFAVGVEGRGERVSVGEGGRGEEGSNTSVQVVAQLSALS